MSRRDAAPLSPWQKITRAAKRGRGIRLSADEVWRLSMDDAISTVAEHDDQCDDERASVSGAVGR